jgi:hypothetical protein
LDRHAATSGRPAPALLESLSSRSFRYQWSADGRATWAAEMETLIY